MGKASRNKRGGGRRPMAQRPGIDRAREQVQAAALRGHRDDDDVPVTISLTEEQPPGTDQLIGIMNSRAILDDGTILEPGARIWHRTGPSGEGQAHTVRVDDLTRFPISLAAWQARPRGIFRDGRLPADVAGRLETRSPGLAARLAAGLDKDELAYMAPQIAQAMSSAGAEPGAYQFGTGQVPAAFRARLVTGAETGGSPGDLPYGLRSGDIIADQQPLGYAETGITLPDGTAIEPGTKVWRAPDAQAAPGTLQALDQRAARLLPPSGRPSPRDLADAEAIRLRASWTPDMILDQHAWLTRRYRQPGDDTADYLAYLMRDVLQRDERQARRAAADFWPVLDTGAVPGLPEGRELARAIGRGLGDAMTCQVTEAMSRKMRAEWEAGETVPVLDEGELPVPAGFAWLDRPWLIRVADGWTPVRTVSWEKVTCPVLDDASGPRHQPGYGAFTAPCARVVLWILIADDVAFGSWDGQLDRADRVVSQIGRLVPQHITLLPFGIYLTYPEDHQGTAQSELGLLHTLWKYLGMTLPRSRPVPAAAAATRKRARQSLRHSDVHVITLRQYVPVGDAPAGAPRQTSWSCRWWVREFYRHIDPYQDTGEDGRRRRHAATPAGRTGIVRDDDHDVCSVCLAGGQTVRITLVRTYDKGPAGLPFRKPAADRTLYRLAR